MENKEIKGNEKMENNETMEMVASGSVQDLSQINGTRLSKRNIFTNITDQKKIFNLESSCDEKINNCKGELIRVKEVLIKIIETPLKEPEINEETGEIIKDKEFKKITILIDDNNRSYVTGSKMFTNQMIDYITMFGWQEFEEGLEIKITERSISNSSNKALGFELV